MAERGIPIRAPADRAVYVGSHVVAPGEVRIFDPADVPPHLRPAAAAPAPEAAPSDPVLALLDGTVREITAALPALSREDLARVRQAEADGKTRKGLMDAIAEEELRRADAAAGAG